MQELHRVDEPLNSPFIGDSDDDNPREVPPAEPPGPSSPPSSRALRGPGDATVYPEIAGPADVADPSRQAHETRLVARCTPEFYRWSQALAEHLSLTLTQTLVHGLIRIAEASGFHTRMPRRYAPKNPWARKRGEPGESGR